MKELLNVIGDRFPLTPRDAGEFAVLKAKGFFGLMKMETLIVNPKEIDLPLYSCDRILAMGIDTLIAELYDTAVGGFSAPELDKIVAEAAALPERDPGKHWYDGIRLPPSGRLSNVMEMVVLVKQSNTAGVSIFLSASAARCCSST